MKLAIVLTACLVLSTSAFARGHGGGGHSSHVSSGGSHSIRGYTRSNGTRVAPAHATNPNHTRNDNYSTRGNTNPHTGKAGTKPRD